MHVPLVLSKVPAGGTQHCCVTGLKSPPESHTQVPVEESKCWSTGHSGAHIPEGSGGCPPGHTHIWLASSNV